MIQLQNLKDQKGLQHNQPDHRKMEGGSSLLNQKQKILEFLDYMYMNIAKPASTPMEMNHLKQQGSCECLPDNK